MSLEEGPQDIDLLFQIADHVGLQTSIPSSDLEPLKQHQQDVCLLLLDREAEDACITVSVVES